MIEDVSFASPEGGLLAGSATGSGNGGDHTSLSADVDISTTPVHVSSDDESPVSKNMDCISPPGAIIHMATQSSDDEFGNGISPMVFHSQELMDDDLFAVKQIFPTTTTTSVNNNVTHDDDIFIRPKPRVHRSGSNSDKAERLAVGEHSSSARKGQSCSSNNNDVENKKMLTNRIHHDENRSSGAGTSTSSDGPSSLSNKECAKRKRQELRKLARQQKELEKEKKKLKRQETLRANGKFQFEEIVVNFENSLYISTIGEQIGTIIQEEEKYGSKLANFQVLNSNDSRSKATNRYLKNSIEWTRQVPGQPCSGFVWTAVVYHGDDFYEFLVDYKEKMKINRVNDASLIRVIENLRLYQKPWIEEFQRKRDQSMHFGVKYVKSKPRIIMVITGWSKSLSSKNKLNRKKNVVITEADVMSVANEIYVRYDVEIQCFDSTEQAGKELKGEYIAIIFTYVRMSNSILT